MAVFQKKHKLRFSQTDYAGIIFYPRYYELLNAVVEDWFAEALGAPFHDLLDNNLIATPLAGIETQFKAPFRIGDVLSFELSIKKLGSRSVTLNVVAKLDDETHIVSTMTHICAHRNLSGVAEWPKPVREKMQQFIKEDDIPCTSQ